MSDYLSLTDDDRAEMLRVIGAKSVEELFCDVPETLRVGGVGIGAGKSQQEVYEILRALSRRNKVYDSVFRGAGCYDHYIPSVVKSICSREEFATAYTPYQAEMSQGILQAFFEYQTMICELTGMEAANASHYSGATAAAEACIMCADKRRRVLAYDNAHPAVLATLRTYLTARGIVLDVLPSEDGKAGAADFSEAGAVYLETPNFYGLIENVGSIAEAAHAAGCKVVLGCNPISLGILKSPGELGADVAVGEGQPLGLPMSFGGPYLGFIATTRKDMRKLPGRIVGETVDANGERAYVLTMQAREQHIRREKAQSNICSNEALCALTAAVYLAATGADGLRGIASACVANAHYFAARLTEAGFKPAFGGEFFHEFVTVAPGSSGAVLDALDKEGILGGLALDEDRILWCCTEKSSKAAMDRAAAIAGGLL